MVEGYRGIGARNQHKAGGAYEFHIHRAYIIYAATDMKMNSWILNKNVNHVIILDGKQCLNSQRLSFPMHIIVEEESKDNSNWIVQTMHNGLAAKVLCCHKTCTFPMNHSVTSHTSVLRLLCKASLCTYSN